MDQWQTNVRYTYRLQTVEQFQDAYDFSIYLVVC